LTDRLLNVDRRIVFLAIVVAVGAAMLWPVPLPIPPSPYVMDVYRAVDAIKSKPNAKVLLSFDFDPASDPELQPVAINVIRQCMQNNIRVVGMALWPEGVGLGRAAFDSVAHELGKERGKHWTFLGYKPGIVTLILNMGENFKSAWPIDYFGTSTALMPVTQDISRLGDFDFVLTLAAGNTIDAVWVTYAVDRYKIKLGGAVTAVMSPDMFPYLQSGQLVGLVSGLAGAAEYEKLEKSPGSATRGMVPQSAAHVVIILFIGFGNIMYLISRRRERAGELSRLRKRDAVAKGGAGG